MTSVGGGGREEKRGGGEGWRLTVLHLMRRGDPGKETEKERII